MQIRNRSTRKLFHSTSTPSTISYMPSNTRHMGKGQRTVYGQSAHSTSRERSS
ncbi:hypothetical protein GBAR_LOCUS10322 [Geodia barretti]|uniref:Uncharacterized protein n=1 Tax=Geodia barretti TaxID=519541 RepID=A0AA35RTB7_GEOBA|nr:hypothetical protein GBAR_LOCUS10322 [Geodia barretti]